MSLALWNILIDEKGLLVQMLLRVYGYNILVEFIFALSVEIETILEKYLFL